MPVLSSPLYSAGNEPDRVSAVLSAGAAAADASRPESSQIVDQYVLYHVLGFSVLLRQQEKHENARVPHSSIPHPFWCCYPLSIVFDAGV